MATQAKADMTDDLADRYRAVRQLSLDIAAPLSEADACLQPMPDASPAKWHLAHTTWFFETFLLRDHLPGYRLHDERHPFLFNSYYEGEGERQPRAERGLIARPSLDEVREWRGAVDAALLGAISDFPAQLIELGLNHEQQHQELMLMDLTAALAAQPARGACGLRRHRRRPRGRRRSAGSKGARGSPKSAMPAKPSRSTMSGRATASCSISTLWRIGR